MENSVCDSFCKILVTGISSSRFGNYNINDTTRLESNKHNKLTTEWMVISGQKFQHHIQGVSNESEIKRINRIHLNGYTN